MPFNTQTFVSAIVGIVLGMFVYQKFVKGVL